MGADVSSRSVTRSERVRQIEIMHLLCTPGGGCPSRYRRESIFSPVVQGTVRVMTTYAPFLESVKRNNTWGNLLTCKWGRNDK